MTRLYLTEVTLGRFEDTLFVTRDIDSAKAVVSNILLELYPGELPWCEWVDRTELTLDKGGEMLRYTISPIEDLTHPYKPFS
jgi:hypothetical protein